MSGAAARLSRSLALYLKSLFLSSVSQTRVHCYFAAALALAPFPRAAIRDGLVPLLTSVTSTSVGVTPPTPNQYYSVLAVDSRGNRSPF